MHIIYRHENKAILHSFRNVLEMNGIRAFLVNEHSVATAHTGMSNFEAELWVFDSADAARAKAIIDGIVAGAAALPSWSCPNCGENNDGNFQLCWQCQSERIETPSA